MKLDLFPTTIWRLGKGESYPDDVLSWALSFEGKESVTYSNRGGFQSQSRGFEDFPYLTYLQDQLKFLPSFQFSNWWVNINRKGDYNIAHVHPGVDLSCVWYLTDSCSASISFISPFIFSRGLMYNATKTDDECFFECMEGELLIFPSDLEHRVMPNLTDEPRVSIAFNLKL